MVLSEIYRSAYLRAASRGSLPEREENYSREQPYEAYKAFTDSRLFGATRIVT